MIIRIEENKSLKYKELIRTINDFPKVGISFKDITPFVFDKDAFKSAILSFESIIKEHECTVIAGIESRGFWFAPAISLEYGSKFLPVRKEGKLPLACQKVSYSLEYGTASIEIPEGLLNKNDKVIIFDDVLATGGTLAACEKLIENTGAEVSACITLLDLEVIPDKILPKCPVYTLFSISKKGDIY